jgi:outer membrane protein assembly factor BamB
MKKAIVHLFAAIPVSIVLLLLVNCGGGGKADQLAWPRWRGPNGDGISKEKEWDPTALSRGPHILWNTDIGIGYSNVSIENGRIYTMGAKQQNAVFCFDAETGKEIWVCQVDGFDEQLSTPTVDDGFVYALTKRGVLLCLKSANGRLVWKQDLVEEGGAVKPYYGFASPPVIEGDLVIVTANASGMAFEKKTGKKVWGSAVPPAKLPNADPSSIGTSNGVDYGAPVIYEHGGKRLGVLTSYEGIHAVEVETGRLRWLHPWDVYSGLQVADPLVLGSRVFLTQYSQDPPLEAFCYLLDVSGEKPNPIWKRHTLSSEISSPVAIDGFIYGCNGGPYVGRNSLRCLSVETGDVLWEQGWGGVLSLSISAADGKLLILEENGTLHIAEASPASYKELARGDVLAGEKKPRKFYTPPVLYRGRIYCRNFAGDLVCIDVRK